MMLFNIEAHIRFYHAVKFMFDVMKKKSPAHFDFEVDLQ